MWWPVVSPVTGVPLEFNDLATSFLGSIPRRWYLRGYRGCHAGHGTEDGTRSVDDRQWWQSRSGESVGNSVNRTRVILYIVSGLAAGIAGILITLGWPPATLHRRGFEFDVISRLSCGTAITGGQGTILGSIIGVLIVGVLNNGLNRWVSPPFSELSKGGAESSR